MQSITEQGILVLQKFIEMMSNCLSKCAKLGGSMAKNWVDFIKAAIRNGHQKNGFFVSLEWYGYGNGSFKKSKWVLDTILSSKGVNVYRNKRS